MLVTFFRDNYAFDGHYVQIDIVFQDTEFKSIQISSETDYVIFLLYSLNLI